MTPDVRDGVSQSLYDTTVGLLSGDTMSNPSIYVTYHDAQAYPEVCNDIRWEVRLRMVYGATCIEFHLTLMSMIVRLRHAISTVPDPVQEGFMINRKDCQGLLGVSACYTALLCRLEWMIQHSHHPLPLAQ